MLDQGQYDKYRKRMAIFNVLEMTPVQDALALFYGKWTARVAFELSNRDKMRFNEIRYKVGGLSNTSLSSALKELESKGLVVRCRKNENAVHGEYMLTEKGKSLYVVFDAIASWAQVHMREDVASIG